MGFIILFCIIVVIRNCVPLFQQSFQSETLKVLRFVLIMNGSYSEPLSFLRRSKSFLLLFFFSSVTCKQFVGQPLLEEDLISFYEDLNQDSHSLQSVAMSGIAPSTGPRCRTLHLALLDFRRFARARSSGASGMAFLPSGESTALLRSTGRTEETTTSVPKLFNAAPRNTHSLFWWFWVASLQRH